MTTLRKRAIAAAEKYAKWYYGSTTTLSYAAHLAFAAGWLAGWKAARREKR